MLLNVFKFTKKQRFSHPILGGLFSALLFSFLWRLMGDLSTIFAVIPLFTLGLMNPQPKPLATAFAVSLVCVSLFLGVEHILNYALYVALPGLALPYLAMQYQEKEGQKNWYPLERLAGVFALYVLGSALILLLVWHLFGVGEKAFEVLQASLKQTPLEAQDKVALLTSYLKLLWPYVPGISMGLFVFMIAIAASLTPKWFKVHKIKYPRPSFLLSDLYLPWWCWKAFAFIGVAWVISLQTERVFIQHLFGNLIAPLTALFILQGLSIVVTFAKKQKNPQMFLVIFYGFVLVFGWTLLILILAGLLEPWLDLRTRLTQRKEKE
mgnify:CR=1 FL=1